MGRILPALRRASIASVIAAATAACGACSKKEAAVSPKSRYPEVPEASLKGIARTNLDSPHPTVAQLDRKKRSQEVVKALGLPWLETLPVVEDETEVAPRTREEVVSRCLATALCAVKGETNDQKLVDGVVTTFAARSFFSPKELTFIRDPKTSERERTNFSWRYECVHVFLWALAYLPELKPPHAIAEVATEMAIIRDKGPAGFTRDAKPRPLSEILDQADLYYRLHWAVIELRLKGTHNAKANEEIIVERHRALNWLIRYMGQEWDDVTTDT